MNEANEIIRECLPMLEDLKDETTQWERYASSEEEEEAVSRKMEDLDILIARARAYLVEDESSRELCTPLGASISDEARVLVSIPMKNLASKLLSDIANENLPDDVEKMATWEPSKEIADEVFAIPGVLDMILVRIQRFIDESFYAGDLWWFENQSFLRSASDEQTSALMEIYNRRFGS